MTDHEACELIFAPGLSTAKELSDVSGRGVGMDIVRANVEKINGSVEVETRRGRGHHVHDPPAADAGDHAVAAGPRRGRHLRPADPRRHRDAAHRAGAGPPRQSPRGDPAARDRAAAGRSARGVRHGRDCRRRRTSTATAAWSSRSTPPNSRQVGLIVDGLVGEQEIVIKPLGQLVGDVAGLSGAAILGDGSVALIVDVAALIAQAIRDNTTVAAERAPVSVEKKTRKRRRAADAEQARAA